MSQSESPRALKSGAVAVFNAGSTSLKFGVYQIERSREALCRGQIVAMDSRPRLSVCKPPDATTDISLAIDGPIDHARAIRLIADWIGRNLDVKLIAAGHRVVLGGASFERPVRIDDHVMVYLASLASIEPGHQSINLACIRAAMIAIPGVPHIACFDSAFHRTMPEVAQRFALPAPLQTPEIRHWGYHGISYEYITRRMAQIAPGQTRVIIAHLGGGSSLCATLNGKSVETSMGLSSLSGLPMATRSGDLPPELLIHLLRTGATDLKRLESSLYHHSGLAGLAGGAGDMRVLEQSTDPGAIIAIAHFVHAILKFIGAYTAVLGGLDALVFTGGIGEHAAPLRAAICRRLTWLGIALDQQANAVNAERISTPSGRVGVFVVPTDEERIIADHTIAVIEA